MKPSVCRKAAWIELTVSVTSVDDHSKLNARYFCASNDENRLEEGRFLLAGKRPYYNQFEDHRHGIAGAEGGAPGAVGHH